MAWEQLPLETDEDAVTRRIIDSLAARIPGWERVEGALDVALAEEFGRESALLAERAVELVDLAAAGLGASVFGVPPDEATRATLPVTFTLTSPTAVIPAGVVVVDRTGPVEVAYRLEAEHTAETTTPTLTLTAVVPGAQGNTTRSGTPLGVATATATVTAAVAAGDATGGADAEPLDTYLTRLSARLSTLRPGGVTAADMATLARSVEGVARAVGLDLLDPDSPGVLSERTVTVVPIDADGQPVAGPVADEVQELLTAAREVNFVVHAAAPTYTALDVVFAAVAESGADPAVVKDAVVDTIAAWLHPSRWGTGAEAGSWVHSPTVRYLDLVRVAGTTPGVAYLSSLTIDGGTADVTLTGLAPLPSPVDDPLDPSTVDGTVV